MNLFGMIDQSGNAMQAERLRAEVVAANMANSETTKTPSGAPYRRQHVVFATGNGDQEFSSIMQATLPSRAQPYEDANMLIPAAAWSTPNQKIGTLRSSDWMENSQIAPGVHIAAVVEDKAPPVRRYDPNHPDADQDGYVSYPDINPLTEMVDLMGATRAFGLNASAVQAEKGMISSSIEILK